MGIWKGKKTRKKLYFSRATSSQTYMTSLNMWRHTIILTRSSARKVVAISSHSYQTKPRIFLWIVMCCFSTTLYYLALDKEGQVWQFSMQVLYCFFNGVVFTAYWNTIFTTNLLSDLNFKCHTQGHASGVVPK